MGQRVADINATNDAGDAMRSMWAYSLARLERLMRDAGKRRNVFMDGSEKIHEFFPSLEYFAS